MSPRMLAGQLRGRVLSRMLRGWVHTARLLRTAAPDRVPVPAPRRARATSLDGLKLQVTAFADAGASSSQIAQRTGLAHDAVALILHFRASSGAEVSTGRGTICRTDRASRIWATDA
ncbi:MAG: hypothetical protein KY464_00650 [Gemmatimonadetes bacterium]|nr:hypothetical protein [Gemmatimonadota bacterium]